MALQDLSRGGFPDGFLFGAATSAYQIEGSGFGSAGLSHWDTFAATPGNVVGGEDGRRLFESVLADARGTPSRVGA